MLEQMLMLQIGLIAQVGLATAVATYTAMVVAGAGVAIVLFRKPDQCVASVLAGE
jgi:hypothetical protein